jgi:hypothetical protein
VSAIRQFYSKHIKWEIFVSDSEENEHMKQVIFFAPDLYVWENLTSLWEFWQYFRILTFT